MDMGLFSSDDRFTTFDCLDDYTHHVPVLDDSSNNSNDYWQFDTEREINGDLALIPMTSSLCESFDLLSKSPPIKEDISKILGDWQQLINIENVEDGAFNHVITESPSNDDLNVSNSFDITSYINEGVTNGQSNFETKPNVTQRKHGAATKRIDLQAQRYIIDNNDNDEDDVDVETVSENGNSPVLEAGDLSSLLEQFEATELPDLQSSPVKTKIELETVDVKKIDQKFDLKDLHSSPVKTNIKLETVDEVKVEKKFDPEVFLHKDPPPSPKIEVKEEINVGKTPPKPVTTATSSPDTQNNMILNQLPKELIDRIKESGKRKPISVIPPMPTRKRIRQDTNAQIRNQKMGMKPPDTIKLDHDYCSVQTNYSKNPKKDSGFESSEDDDRVNIKHQPIVKNTDGTLMVSLLKVNTIHHDSVKKRKLNLEEYKKRRIGVLRTKTAMSTSQSGSPFSSTCNSPTPEDEHIKIKKHQEKLMQMAKEVLTAAPKSEPSPTNNNNSNNNLPVVTPEPPTEEIVPPDMIKKTVVSIGVNTDFVTIDKEFKEGKLEEIQPLLAKVGGQINRNSLITSVIENIPKVLSNSKNPSDQMNKPEEKVKEHGEDKTILFIPKHKKAVKTVSTGIQTNISLLTCNKQRRYRRRNSSASSTSSDSSVENENRHYSRRRKLSNSSDYSDSSSSSSSYAYSRSSSRSRSRSISPKPRRKTRIEKEHVKEVEERRVIYVGRISSNTTKEDLRKRFGRFGPITNISLHFRDHGDNYGFVTFSEKYDAYEAIEHGNDDPYLPKYDISFGGRRLFCQTSYSDLDNVRDDCGYSQGRSDDSFDKLLKEAQEKLRKRKV